jgi:hypothetical protein
MDALLAALRRCRLAPGAILPTVPESGSAPAGGGKSTLPFISVVNFLVLMWMRGSCYVLCMASLLLPSCS